MCFVDLKLSEFLCLLVLEVYFLSYFYLVDLSLWFVLVFVWFWLVVLVFLLIRSLL